MIARFVQQIELWALCQQRGDSHALTFTSRKGGDVALRHRLKIHFAECVACLGDILGVFPAPFGQMRVTSQQCGFHHRRRHVVGTALKKYAEVCGQFSSGPGVQVMPQQKNFTSICRAKIDEGMQQRGLAGAVLPQHADTLACFDCQIEIAKKRSCADAKTE